MPGIHDERHLGKDPPHDQPQSQIDRDGEEEGASPTSRSWPALLPRSGINGQPAISSLVAGPR